MSYVKLNHDFAKFLEQSYYIDALNYNSDAACLLRLHLLAEQFLNVFLDDYPSENQKKFLKAKYFDQKNQIAVALGMPTELASALSLLGKIRNKFAHSLEYQLNKNADVRLYIDLVNKFQVEQLNESNGWGPITNDFYIAGINTKTNQEQRINITDGPRAAFTIATYILLTKAGLWAVNALNQIGKLSTEELASDDPLFTAE